VRYADDFQVYVKSKAAGERVMTSLEGFLEKRLRLKVNREKSAVDRPWKRKFLGYTVHHEPEAEAEAGSEVGETAEAEAEGTLPSRPRVEPRADHPGAQPDLRGWGHYFRLADVKGVFEELDQWIRRRLRVLLWRQWKRPRTRFNELRNEGWTRRSAISAHNGYGPWWNAGASHMNQAVPASTFAHMGLVSLLDQHRRLKCSTREPPDTEPYVRWCGRAAAALSRRALPDSWGFFSCCGPLGLCPRAAGMPAVG
jgi:RNA-directed DNA polymerase